MLTKIPKIELNVSYIMARGDNIKGLFTYPSDIYGAGYLTDGEEVLIVTSHRGYLRLTQKQVGKLIDELQNIKEDNDRFR